MNKYIIDKTAWQEACNGIACKKCSMLDGDTCRIDKYIQKQPIYVEAELDTTNDFAEWEFVGDNLFMCTHCGYVANANWLREWKQYTYDDEFPTACPKCGASMRVKDELNRVNKELNSEIEKSKSEICPCIECRALLCRKGCSDYKKWKEGDEK